MGVQGTFRDAIGAQLGTKLTISRAARWVDPALPVGWSICLAT
jgi:hypothetical protein